MRVGYIISIVVPAVAAIGATLDSDATDALAKRTVGDFFYRTATGQEAGLADPASGRCINLPSTSEDAPGDSPRNFCASRAIVFLEPDCEGDTYFVMKPGTKLGPRLKLSSVVFG